MARAIRAESDMAEEIHTPVRDLPIDYVLMFADGRQGKRISNEDYDHLIRKLPPNDDAIMGIEEDGIPFIAIPDGFPFLLPGDGDVVRIPDIPKAFEEM